MAFMNFDNFMLKVIAILYYYFLFNFDQRKYSSVGDNIGILLHLTKELELWETCVNVGCVSVCLVYKIQGTNINLG
jgi:hypothetical protein